ncbi:UvrD-helicase domain-containing protein [Leucobacter tardus]|uniref:DNA 3'-5' helicase n=2 Tax=Leucobacter tardus TaxID=501483 RepID=A0A939TUD3_9MICO|nr:ATP-dependent helicase [Leucobacter tardus]
MSGPEDLLAALDPDQRAIAECLRGPVRVLAGAGTGKTRTITHRIAYGVRSGVYAADRVLAVTFTRKAAGELQGRLRALGAEGVRAHTFHGAALAQLGYFWPQFVGGPAPKVLSGKVATVSQAVESQGWRFGAEALRDIAAEIEWRKVSMLSIDAYARRVDDRALPSGMRAEQMVEAHRAYERLTDERRQIDFEDVLILLTGMLETEPRAALQVRERYGFFTVDEYQDVSPLQHALLRVWLGGRDEICVVGDASQTIYSFAGASSEHLLRFGSEHPGMRAFTLERNYRSAPAIVRAANRLMRDRPGALTLEPLREGGSDVAPLSWFGSEHDEAEAVAASIAERIHVGVPASEIAVLYRTNSQSALVEEALTRRGVSFRVHGGQRFFDRADVRQVVIMMRGQAKVADPRPLFQIVSDILRSAGWTAHPPETAAGRERWEAMNAILGLVDEMPPGAGVREFADELTARQNAQHEPTLDAVTLSAIHSSKGLEWSLVHVIGLVEGTLPIAYASDEAGLEEERRLTYVALTRAKEELRISGSGGRAGRRGGRPPSRFAAEAGLEPRPLDAVT